MNNYYLRRALRKLLTTLAGTSQGNYIRACTCIYVHVCWEKMCIHFNQAAAVLLRHYQPCFVSLRAGVKYVYRYSMLLSLLYFFLFSFLFSFFVFLFFFLSLFDTNLRRRVKRMYTHIIRMKIFFFLRMKASIRLITRVPIVSFVGR